MKSKTEILYASSLCSQYLLDYIFETSAVKPIQNAQKFHRLLAEGFGLNSDACSVETLSVIPVSRMSHKRKIWHLPSEKVDNISFNYIPMINLPILKNVIVFIFSFLKIWKWSFSKKGSNKVIICDALNFSVSSAAILACKLSRIKIVGIVTDLPDLMVGKNKKFDLKYKVYKVFSNLIIMIFDKYIILTEQMNRVVNPHHKPFIVMEGLVDVKMKKKDNSLIIKDSNKVLLYSGGIFEKYGIKTLIEAFMKIEDERLRLYIFGQGEMEKQMFGYMKEDERVVYKGIVPNSDVVECQLAANLLINPRPTNEEFTKFSFPSKIMEYMVSGTPMVTTKLQGMPQEYYEYVYFFEDESVEGMKNTLQYILQKSDHELKSFGSRAKQFVLNNKSNFLQAKRILDFLKEE